MKKFIKKTLNKPAQWLVEAASSIKMDFSMLSHEVTNELVEHTLKRHGNRNIHGAATIMDTDFDRIPDIVKAPDYAIVGAIRKETIVIAYAKIYENTTYLYFDDVLISRKNKTLRGKTLYKVSRTLSFEEFIKNVSMNGKTDISKSTLINEQKNVQTAGSHPGG